MTAPVSGSIRIGIVGAGTIGRGWAALAASHGWPVTILDTDVKAMDEAMIEIAGRVRALVALGRAESSVAESGLAQLKAGRSILQACGEAAWIIECASEDLALKQRILENIESVARPDAIISSSSSGLTITDELWAIEGVDDIEQRDGFGSLVGL